MFSSVCQMMKAMFLKMYIQHPKSMLLGYSIQFKEICKNTLPKNISKVLYTFKNLTFQIIKERKISNLNKLCWTPFITIKFKILTLLGLLIDEACNDLVYCWHNHPGKRIFWLFHKDIHVYTHYARQFRFSILVDPIHKKQYNFRVVLSTCVFSNSVVEI